jgi:hypothetical protein
MAPATAPPAASDIARDRRLGRRDAESENGGNQESGVKYRLLTSARRYFPTTT